MLFFLLLYFLHHDWNETYPRADVWMGIWNSHMPVFSCLGVGMAWLGQSGYMRDTATEFSLKDEHLVMRRYIKVAA